MTNARFSIRAFTAPSAVALLVAGALLAGCGGTSSSSSTSTTTATKSAKPAYCSDVSSLQQSVKALTEVHVAQNGTKALESAAKQVEKDAAALEDSVKNEFSTQTSALKSSVNDLAATVKQFASSPTKETLSKISAAVSGVSTSVKNFASAASTKCG